MNKFYKQPAFLQWTGALLMLIIGSYPAILIIEAGYIRSINNGLFLFYIPLGQFCFTPLLKLTGVYRYYSPMLLGYTPSATRIELHSGSSFDYLLVMSGIKPGIAIRNTLLGFYLEGLLYLIGQIERGKIPGTVLIEGNSYFFNRRTAQKVGFTESRSSWFHTLNILVNFIDIVWMYSLSKGRLSVPALLKVKRVTITGSKLVDRKAIIANLHTALYEKLN